MKRKIKNQTEVPISEFLSQVMANKNISVRQLAKKSNLSPTIVQAMRSGTKKDFNLKSFFKILNGLGCKKLTTKIDNKTIPIKITP